MNLNEAILEANSRSRNINLQWFVSKWNDGYIIHSTAYMKRFPDTEYVYTTGTGNISIEWTLKIDNHGKTKHIIK